MSHASKYFVIPFANVPDNPTYTVWYASWSTERPILEPGMLPPCTIGVTGDGKLPPGATLVATSTKEPPPPPPALAASTPPEYEAAFSTWLELTKDG
jgi:hypothetical protein